MAGIPVTSIVRGSDGKLPAFSSVGCYPILYLTRKDDVLCAECASKPDSTAHVCDVYYEGAPLECDECGAEIESAYGDPEAEEREADE